MVAYLLRRLGLAAAVALGAISLLFAVLYVIPGDPAAVVLGPRASPEVVAAFRERMGLDLPWLVQLWRFLSNMAQGDLGTDLFSGRPVATIIGEQIPFTLALIGTSIFWSAILGIAIGVLSATRPGSVIDVMTGVVSVAVIALPSFVVAVYALLLFSVELRWFPAIGVGEPGSLSDQLFHLVLPAFAVGLGWVGYLARVVRASMLDVLTDLHVQTAQAFGLPPNVILRSYVLRIAVLPAVTLLGVGIGALISGAVFAEIVFSRPGIGKLAYTAISTRNYPVVAGCVLVTTLFYIAATLVADLVAAWLDPRQRLGLTR